MSTTTRIASISLDVEDVATAEPFYAAAFGLGSRLQVRTGTSPSAGFRGYLLSLVVAQPSTVDSLVGTAVDGGATVLKPAARSFWGYGGVVRAPDGAIWKIASSAKKDTGPVGREVDDVVLLLGVDDVKATKRFYTERGLTVARGFGSKYVEFDTAPVKLALYSRRAAAKDAGVAAEGSGSHRLTILGDAGGFTDPDGFAWETTVSTDRSGSASLTGGAPAHP